MWGHYFLPLGLFRTDKTQVLHFYQYNDTDDIFAREPFVAQFTLPSKSKRGKKSGPGTRKWEGCGWFLGETGGFVKGLAAVAA